MARFGHSLGLLVCLLQMGILLPASAQQPDEWAGSDSCIECHEDRHASWYRTYHRSMTQTANPETVQGRFDGQPLTYWGVTIKPVRRNNEYWFDYSLPDSNEVFASYQVVRTVGSHRYQQYLTQVDGAADNYYRLHLLWHIQEQRWVHMNGAFLSPDEQGFDDNVALWNHNCIFCHNTGPEPNIQNYAELRQRADQGLAIDLDKQSLYQSRVAELGIACESCHGPSAEHVRINRNPLKRWWNKLRDRDASVVHPDRLSQTRSVQVCGQCHGQRTPVDGDMARRWVHTGPAYRAGQDLLASVIPVSPDTRVPGDSDADRYRLRFWPDGTPRLSAYEYQGLLLSRCYTDSQTLTCSNCHSMHGGDPEGMTTEWQRGNGPCLECHQEYADDPEEHTHHAADSSGSLCSNCHMPKIVYGVMTIHRSHRIEIPEPARHSAQQRPNACNQCHLDQSVQWAAERIEQLWGGSAGPQAEPASVAAGVYDLYAGDPVQRAVAAWSLEQAIGAGQQPGSWWMPHLLNVMRADSYPAVRRFAARALRAASVQQDAGAMLSALAEFDFIGAPEQRAQALRRLVERWRQLPVERPLPPGLLLDGSGHADAGEVAELQALGAQRSVGISVGE